MARVQVWVITSKGGNPRLDTLQLLAEGLKSELLLIPREKLAAVRAVLLGQVPEDGKLNPSSDLLDDPWKDVLGDLRDE